MLEQLTRNWWVLALRGVAAIMFGVCAFAWPGLTLAVLVALFGAYALIDGIFAIISGVRQRREFDRWWVLALQGLLGVVAGVVAFVAPGITALSLVYLMAMWAITTGALQVAAAVVLRREIEGEWFLALGGVAAVVFGVLIALRPGAGALTLVWLIGGYAIAAGVLLVGLAFQLRGGHGAEHARAPAQ